jgi:hypothetical protein
VIPPEGRMRKGELEEALRRRGDTLRARPASRADELKAATSLVVSASANDDIVV